MYENRDSEKIVRDVPWNGLRPEAIAQEIDILIKREAKFSETKKMSAATFIELDDRMDF